jgi:hypothetical protein
MAYTDTVNSLNETINQSINRWRVGLFFGCNPGRRPVVGKQPQQWFFVGWRVGIEELQDSDSDLVRR